MRKSISLPPRQLRRRESMQEQRFQHGHSFSFPKRRLERHSSSVTPQISRELSLLKHLQVEFVKAFVPASKLSSPRYVMRVTNTALNQSWEMGRTFKEFYELKESIVNLLDHGHFCTSNCPWIYMYVTHHFPRRHLFRSRSPSVISSRLTELQTFINTVLAKAKDTSATDCSISTHSFPHLIYNFLYEGMIFDASDFNNTVLEDRMSIGGNLRGSIPEIETCSICRRSLFAVDTNITISPPCSNNDTNMKAKTLTKPNASNSSLDTINSSTDTSSSSTESCEELAAMTSLTTLECGHCFHDECILAKLNESLKCPLCVEMRQQQPQDEE